MESISTNNDLYTVSVDKKADIPKIHIFKIYVVASIYQLYEHAAIPFHKPK